MPISVIEFFLFSYSQFVGVKDCVKQKKRNTSYNQYLLSSTNELCSNLNNKLCSNLVQNITYKFELLFPLYLWVCQSFTV